MSSYFSSSSKRGELFELSEQLNSTDKTKKKEAIKKVIAHMTIGKDVSPLFHPVVKCLEHDDVELKKLVYLYIINYSRNRPDDAIVVIQLFRRDISNKHNPMLRALAVRTMGCIKVNKLNEYLAGPLKDALNDKEPYVRKTAVLCIPKIYEVSPELVAEQGLIQALQELLEKEGNALVLANLIVALREISAIQKTDLITITPQILQRVLLAVNECVEWGQIQIMEFLANYIPAKYEEAELIVERILPRLSHINPAVVFMAVKVVVKYLDYLGSGEIVKHLCGKLTPSLVSLLTWDKPEIKFVILKSINHILAKQPGLLDKEIKCFYCNFNEPYYIKREKLDILASICDKNSWTAVLNELELYVSEPDPQFVRRSIKVICSIAIRFSSAVEQALKILLNVIKNVLEAKMGGEVYVQEIIVSLQKIYRKYPNKIKFENGLNLTVDILEYANEEDSKGSAVYILGEFAEHIPTSIKLITERIKNFSEEERRVQLEILTAAIKVFVKYPDDGKEFIQELLETAAYKTLNPDVRDRAFIYWRMLSSDPEATKNTVLCQKPQIEEEGVKYEPEFLEIMMDTLGQISSVFQINPHEIFTGRSKPQSQDTSTQPINQNPTALAKKQSSSSKSPSKVEGKKESAQENNKQEKELKLQAPPQESNLLDFDDVPQENNVQNQNQNQNQNNNAGGGDLLDLLDVPSQQNTQNTQNNQNNANQGEDPFDLLGGDSGSMQQNQPSLDNYKINLEQVLDQSQPGKNGVSGLRIEACLNRVQGKSQIEFRFTNYTNQQLTNVAVSLRPNFFSLKFDQIQFEVNCNNNGGQTQITAPLNSNGQQDQNYPNMPLKLDVGVKTNFDIYYFQLPVMFHTVLGENGQLDGSQFKQVWKGVPDENEMNFEVKKLNPSYKDPQYLQQAMKLNNMFQVAQRINDKGQQVTYFSQKTDSGIVFATEVSIPSLNNPNGASISCKSQHKQIIPLILQCTNFILTH